MRTIWPRFVGLGSGVKTCCCVGVSYLIHFIQHSLSGYLPGKVEAKHPGMQPWHGAASRLLPLTGPYDSAASQLLHRAMNANIFSKNFSITSIWTKGNFHSCPVSTSEGGLFLETQSLYMCGSCFKHKIRRSVKI